MITCNIHKLELPLGRTNFRGQKGVRAIEVRLYKAAYLYWFRSLNRLFIIPVCTFKTGQSLCNAQTANFSSQFSWHRAEIGQLKAF